MEISYESLIEKQNAKGQTKNPFKGVFGLIHPKDVSQKAKRNKKNNVVEDREELFKEIFGTSFTEDQNELDKIIKSKIEGLDEAEKQTIEEKLVSKAQEMEAALTIKKSKTLKRLLATVALLTIAIISTWYLFENDIIINLKLILCQSAIIGFICGFKEMHVLIQGKKESF